MTDDDSRPSSGSQLTVTVTPGMHGNVSVFDGMQEDWIESYFVANDIAKKRAILFNAVGPSTYRLIKTLCLPDKPKDYTFEEIVKKLTTHFNPKQSVIIKRFEFKTRKQEQGETVAEYVAALRKIAEHCEYSDILSEMLRDRLHVCGIADKRVQNRYLRETKLTYADPRDMALAADKDAKRLRAVNEEVVHPGSSSAHKEAATIAHVNKRPVKPRNGSRTRSSPQTGAYSQGGCNSMSCCHCGGDRDASCCKLKEYACWYCRKKGHLAAVCRKKKRDEQAPEKNKIK